MKSVLTPPKLMISGRTMRCRKARRILRYHVPRKLFSPEKFDHNVLLLFYPFRDEKELSSDFPTIHNKTLQDKGVEDVENTINIKQSLTILAV